MIIDRIKEVISSKKVSTRKFAEIVGFNYTTLNNYCTGLRTTIDSALLEKIASTYVDINMRWLLTGLGEMYHCDSLSISEPHAPEQSIEAMVYYNLYKEERSKVDSQAKEIWDLKLKIQSLEEMISGLQQIHSEVLTTEKPISRFSGKNNSHADSATAHSERT